MDEPYRQEYLEGEAEDWRMMAATGVTVTVPAGTWSGCVTTEDWNALEDYEESLEETTYCPGAGWVREVPVESPEETVELVELGPP